ncbi:MAG: DUF4384 domain-containing protein [Spirochaetota bacterium]
MTNISKKIFIVFTTLFSFPILSLPKMHNGKFTLAVVGSQNSKIRAKIESALLRSEFIHLVERQKMQKILSEISLGQSGALQKKSSSKIGKLLGTSFLVLLNDSSFRLVETETARIKGSWDSYSEAALQQMLTILETEAALVELVKIKPPPSDRKNVYFGEVECFGNRGTNAANPKVDLDSLDDLEDEEEEESENEMIPCSFRLGERIGFKYFVFRKDERKQVYLTILAYTSDGNIIQLFPNQYQRDNQVLTKKEAVFPSKNAKFKVTASEPLGTDRIVMIASLKPVGLPGNSPKAGIYLYSNTNNKQKTKGITVSLRRLGKTGYDVKYISATIRK